MQQREERAKARSRALRLLASRDRATREIAERLRRHGHEESVVEWTIAWLQERGFLDDLRFARSFSAEKQRAGWGPRRVTAELARKGVGRDVLAELAASWEEDGAQADALTDDLVALVRRRFGRELAEDPLRGRRRAVGFLQRRGHDWEAVEKILSRATEPEGSGEPVGGGPEA